MNPIRLTIVALLTAGFAFAVSPLPAQQTVGRAELQEAHREARAQAISACPDPALGAIYPTAPDRSQAPIVLWARQLDARNEEYAKAQGNVELFRADQHLETDVLLYSPATRTISMPGHLNYEDSQLWINAESAEYGFESESGEFLQVDYGLTGSSANGQAEAITLHGGHTSNLTVMDYTTCPGDKPDWQLSARELKLRHDEGIGIARGAKLKFKGVPILYAPIFSFPIDDRRKSGFLYPGFSNTNDNGFELGIPYYWNIRPNMDATIEPRYFTSRGFMLTGEYRFLTRRTRGFLDFDYMPDDSKTDEARYHYRVSHGASFSKGWSTRILLDRVSDDEYFQDFGSSLDQTSKQFARSSAVLTGVGRYWNFEMLFDDFQVIDDSVGPLNEPYRRLPRLGFFLDRPFGVTGIGFKLNSELVYFDKEIGITGGRLDLMGELYWERFTGWGFIRPGLAYRYTSYELDYPVGDDPGPSSPHRSLPIASLDAGLFFEKSHTDGGFQMLEPRIFYLYVPFEDQQNLPRFDTGEFTFGFSQLFNTNRFSGSDRQGDAHQLSLALTTRSVKDDGQETWSFSVGQIIYLEDRQMQLKSSIVDEDTLSPLVAELAWHPFRRISTRAGLQWDWNQDRLDVGSIGFSYNGKAGLRAIFDYRFRRDRVDQFDFRFFWPVNERWRVISRLNYSFADEDLLEAQAGFEYESCCWAVRTVYRRYLKNRDGDFRDGIYFELNLKGLASVGTGSQNRFHY